MGKDKKGLKSSKKGKTAAIVNDSQLPSSSTQVGLRAGESEFKGDTVAAGSVIASTSTSTPVAASTSLSSFLLSQAEVKDSALEDLFAHSKGPSVAFTNQGLDSEKKGKKKKKDKRENPTEGKTQKPKKAKGEDNSKKIKTKVPIQDDDSHVEEIEIPNDADLSELDSDEELDLELPSDSDEDAGVEEAYAARAAASRLKAPELRGKESKKKRKAIEVEEDDSEEQEELDIDNLVHETLLPRVVYSKVPLTKKEEKKIAVTNESKKPGTKADKGDAESPQQRDARTIFIGNVPVSCSTTKSMKKGLIRHVLQSPALLAALPESAVPLKADSIRFRSLAFASTVFGRKESGLNADGTEAAEEAGGHGRKRAKEWRENEDTDERGVMGGYRQKEKAPELSNRKTALTDGQKRRVAFIKGELNEGKKACNAYLVIEPLPATCHLSMGDMMKVLVDVTNGSSFEGFTLRADHVRPRSSAAILAAAQMASKPATTAALAPSTAGTAYSVPATEARRTLFVGGLDFAESEENIRAATEIILVKQRGPSGEKGWVEGVRIIRDASTGLGKGFGYVLMRDADCVDELLALPFGQPLKVSKRKVRLERCKTGVAAARSKAANAARDLKAVPSSKGGSTPSSAKYGGAAAPRDPSFDRMRASNGFTSTPNSTSASEHREKLAEALAKLAPDERKKIKAVDPERLWRRAQKKKNKVLSERYERKQVNESKKKGGGILGRESRGAERARKEKKRVAIGNKTGKRAKKSDL